jgi:quinol monooxygenase YgiN
MTSFAGSPLLCKTLRQSLHPDEGPGVVILSVFLRVPPGQVEALRPHMRRVIAASRAEAGCIFYTLAEDMAEPGLIRAFEVYRDDAALKTHGESAHFQAWRAVSGQYPREGRTLYDAAKRD